MGESDDFGVRIAALHAAATTLRDNAASLGQRARAVGDHAFGIGNDQAGRNYAAQGTAMHQGFERAAACLRYWGAAAAATADVFDRAATEYARLDHAHATALTGVGR
ncbi:hypothetical protein [Nocardia aurantiaca]|uniref:ESX-1 secretion-associated protein n=1 Tax=Nocardia aurantiaca TaxID=2675850 RepID=A0A6I3KQM8_9NOCA|nr:hypothetical protein [Nocardia aurantiaca]MTE11631.1 hypothetical protein [Nocardia aurantiaca]